MALTCPLCHGALQPAEKSFRCAAGHSFDRAKEGYLSLLHGRQKGEGRGDSKAMILARDRVHRAGIFDPLVAALTALPLPALPQTLLDLGCGEGFFLHHVAQAHRIPTSFGLDLSVDAVKLAARSLTQSLIVRADLLHPLPFADESIDLIQSIFAPRPLAEIHRVLRPGGHALFVYPQADHWHELRAFIPLAAIGSDKLNSSELDGFAPVHAQDVRAPRNLSHDQLVNLVEMSPSIHRLTREGESWQSRLPAHLTVTLSVRVAVLAKSRRPDATGS